MSIPVNIRLDEKYINELDKVVEKVKKELPRGATISRTSIISCAVEDYLKERESFKLVFDLNDLSKEELRELYFLIVKMHEAIPQDCTPEEYRGKYPKPKIYDLMEDQFIKFMQYISNLEIEKGYFNK